MPADCRWSGHISVSMALPSGGSRAISGSRRGAMPTAASSCRSFSTLIGKAIVLTSGAAKIVTEYNSRTMPRGSLPVCQMARQSIRQPATRSSSTNPTGSALTCRAIGMQGKPHKLCRRLRYRNESFYNAAGAELYRETVTLWPKPTSHPVAEQRRSSAAQA